MHGEQFHEFHEHKAPANDDCPRCREILKDSNANVWLGSSVNFSKVHVCPKCQELPDVVGVGSESGNPMIQCKRCESPVLYPGAEWDAWVADNLAALDVKK